MDKEETTAPLCSCGHGLDHHMVSEAAQYTRWGTFRVFFMGISTAPMRIDYRCRVCKEVLKSTSDPKILQQFH